MTLIHLPKSPILFAWAPLAFAISVIIASFYIGAQQAVRQAADYPQIQIAQDLATDLFQNKDPSVSLKANVDIEKSLAPFVILFDSNGKAVEGTGKINDKLAQVPSEMLESARQKTEHRTTWQASKTTQVATVVRYYQNSKRAGFVLSGRNIRETQKQTSNLLLISTVAWALSLTGSLALAIALNPSRK